ncbi:hypothetical protein LO771_20865 [Streptacidiphilus sp. ASG 303]|uniref:hypothetical protein n=1 Tax=Streptacidiphilus sp. ASG 303 TaxID=2896847 RepID=UPI001E3DE496|nr:hypothetical protein [Streptacidiphilus sp. ASG 303]MCD0484778.1 hypothetical protein [Streptacidiphilus sp. ASG 303]
MSTSESQRFHDALDELAVLYRSAIRTVATISRGVSHSACTLESLREDVRLVRRADAGPEVPHAVGLHPEDDDLTPLHLAACTGPREAAALLAELAGRAPAQPPRAVPPAGAVERSCVALLSWQYHGTPGVEGWELFAGADRTEVATMLARIALQFAEEAGVDVPAWLARAGADAAAR